MICFSWLGFPQYGARCVRAFVQSTSEKVAVVASRPTVPVKGMDELAGCEVYWVGLNEHVTLKEILGEVPRVLTVPGWRFPLFNRFRDEVRRAGGKVIAGVDNNFDLSIRAFVKMVQFRLFYSGLYDGFWVPRKSGYRLMRFYGVPKEKIFTGSYSADESIFENGKPLAQREKRLLFVGQFIGRKNVLRLCQAFLRANEALHKEWMLEMCGCGELKSSMPNDPAILVHDFVQPEHLAKIYQNARAFILPSEEEHWGVVLHEAALSGCVILSSKKCGAAEDFLEDGVNGFMFSPFSIQQMTLAISKVMLLTESQLAVAQKKSVELGHSVSLKTFVDSVNRFSSGAALSCE